ncbi:MAG: hypothetical protein MZV64_30090 [Ignavibacteriales bacterium]|nr:hypothetical protein [Ignavibacteriales bacterium]
MPSGEWDRAQERTPRRGARREAAPPSPTSRRGRLSTECSACRSLLTGLRSHSPIWGVYYAWDTSRHIPSAPTFGPTLMHLLIVRHAIAVPHGTPDVAERPTAP